MTVRIIQISQEAFETHDSGLGQAVVVDGDKFDGELSSTELGARSVDVGKSLRLYESTIAVPETVSKPVELSSNLKLALCGYHHCVINCHCAKARMYLSGHGHLELKLNNILANMFMVPNFKRLMGRYHDLIWYWDHFTDKVSIHSDAVRAVRAGDRLGWLNVGFGPNGRSGVFVTELLGSNISNLDLASLEQRLAVKRRHFANHHLDICRSRIELADATPLTARETDVVRLIASGKSNPAIAELLDLSAHTINGYLRRIYLKTGTTERVTLTLYAYTKGIF